MQQPRQLKSLRRPFTPKQMNSKRKCKIRALRNLCRVFCKIKQSIWEGWPSFAHAIIQTPTISSSAFIVWQTTCPIRLQETAASSTPRALRSLQFPNSCSWAASWGAWTTRRSHNHALQCVSNLHAFTLPLQHQSEAARRIEDQDGIHKAAERGCKELVALHVSADANSMNSLSEELRWPDQ